MVLVKLRHLFVRDLLPANILCLYDACWHEKIRVDAAHLHPHIIVVKLTLVDRVKRCRGKYRLDLRSGYLTMNSNLFHVDVKGDELDELPADLRFGASFLGAGINLILGDQPLDHPHHQHTYVFPSIRPGRYHAAFTSC